MSTTPETSTLNTVIQLRHDTEANWSTQNAQDRVLKDGEMGISFDANGKPSFKFGYDGKKWSELDFYASAQPAKIYDIDISKVVLDSNKEGAAQGSIILSPEFESSGKSLDDDVDVIGEVASGDELQAGDIAIIRRPIGGGAISYTSYVYDGTNWTATDGNYSANNVFFKDDITVTTPIGTVTQTMINNGNGSHKLSAEGKSLATVLSQLMAEAKNPTTDTPSISSAISYTASKEVGETYTVPTAIITVTDIGSYTYGTNKGSSTTATGIKFAAGDVTLSYAAANRSTSNASDMVKNSTLSLQACAENATSEDKTKTYDETSGGVKYTFTASAKYTTSPETIPVNNIGDQVPSFRIGAGTYGAEDETNKVSVTVGGTLSATYSGYRNWFYGYIAPNANADNLIDVSKLSGKANEAYATGKFRAMTKSNGAFTTSLTTTKMQQIFFAAPKGIVSSVSVKNSKNDAPQTITKITDVYIQGANSYAAIEYDVFYASNAGAEGGTTTFTVTTTKA